jgi:hypothetical protein
MHAQQRADLRGSFLFELIRAWTRQTLATSIVKIAEEAAF